MDSPGRIRKLSILIPVYNEIRTLERLLQSVLDAPLPCERELVIVDDCSRDGSREFLTEFAANRPNIRLVLHKRNGGKGAAIRTAIRHMTGDWAIIQDADLEYDPRDYARLLVPVQEGVADAVFGSRFLTGNYRRAMFFWHTMVNKLLTLTSNVLNDLNLTDMETCYKLVRADILKNLIIRSKGFDLEPELTAKLARWGARIYEVPISYRGRTYAEGKKIGPRDAVRAFLAMVRYRYFDVVYTRHEGFVILQSLRRARGFNRWLFSQFSPYLGDQVLEAGCGIGNLTELMLDRKRLVCVDLDDFYVDRLAQNYGYLANFRIGRADLTKRADLRAAIEDRPVDSIVCVNVLEHIEQDEEVLGHFHDLLAPGGRVVLLVPHDPALFTGVDEALGHCRRYTRGELTTKMQAAGFKVVKCKGFNRVGGLGWRLSGKVLGRRTITPGQMAVFELLLPLIRFVERFPFHSSNSLIAIGEKSS
ncbi:MAG: glycosyltransferase [Candidatus Sumerlaeia bacterium]|nr:glycosyltransferase [Candidatus Sumerlaeia bacterium]